MDTVTVDKLELLDILKQNRSNHRGTFMEAIKAYRKAWHSLLEERIRELEAGQPINRAFMLPQPEDHTNDYDTIISMLEMSIDQEIDIGQIDYRRFVLDEWDWIQSWQANTVSYVEGQ